MLINLNRLVVAMFWFEIEVLLYFRILIAYKTNKINIKYIVKTQAEKTNELSAAFQSKIAVSFS